MLSSLQSDGPLQLRKGDEKIYLVGGGAVPLGGDDLRLTIAVGRNATLKMSSVAAMLAQPGASGDQSVFTTTITVEQGAELEWAPLPTISVRGSDHVNNLSIDLAGDSKLRLVEDCRLGRWNEDSGILTTTLRIERAGRALLHHTNRFGDDAAGWSWPGVDGTVRRVATSVRTNPDTMTKRPVTFGDFSTASMIIGGLGVTVDVHREAANFHAHSELSLTCETAKLTS